MNAKMAPQLAATFKSSSRAQHFLFVCFVFVICFCQTVFVVLCVDPSFSAFLAATFVEEENSVLDGYAFLAAFPYQQ